MQAAPILIGAAFLLVKIGERTARKGTERILLAKELFRYA
jgi:hypothetical protein